jgi:molybdate transport system substrate-binding protein
MRNRRLHTFFAFVPLLLLIAQSAHAQASLQIAAAANLQKVFDNVIIPAYQKKTGTVVAPSYGATALLAKQLENGAPFQVFVSADVKTVDKLVSENLLDPKSEQVYAVGQLVLWSKSLPVDAKKLSILTSSDVTNIAVANPMTAPYGAATIQTLTTLHELDQLQPKIVQAENIGQALQYGESGNADVAFTALSLVIDGSAGGSYYIVPDNLHAPIAQAVAVATKSRGGARRFEQFLLSLDGQKLFAQAGYLPPPKGK